MMFKPAFELGDRVSPYFAGTMPLRWALVHYSEAAKDRYALDGVECWRKVLFPVYGMYLALFRAHLPVGVITDSQLEEGVPGGCRVLLVPAPDDLTDRMRQVVERFEADGGAVVRHRPEWAWHDPEGQQLATDADMYQAVVEP